MAQQSVEKRTRTRNDWFGVCSSSVSTWLGSKWGFAGAVCIVLIWGTLGPIFHYSDSWQLVINTGTTIVTFLMVFLIQNTQNRDARAINLKLDELIHAIDKARNNMIDIENLSDLELDALHRKYEKLKEARPAKRSHRAIAAKEPGASSTLG
jgi:low affinity Fe/Cu permease